MKYMSFAPMYYQSIPQIFLSEIRLHNAQHGRLEPSAGTAGAPTAHGAAMMTTPVSAHRTVHRRVHGGSSAPAKQQTAQQGYAYGCACCGSNRFSRIGMIRISGFLLAGCSLRRLPGDGSTAVGAKLTGSAQLTAAVFTIICHNVCFLSFIGCHSLPADHPFRRRSCTGHWFCRF